MGGKPSEFSNYVSVEEYLLAKSRVNDETPLVEGAHCRDWTGLLTPQNGGCGGYGRTCVINGRLWLAHRLSHLTFNGEFPEDKPLACHRCNRPSCIEPKHLYAGDKADNMRDLTTSGHTHPPCTTEHRKKLSIAARRDWDRRRVARAT